METVLTFRRARFLGKVLRHPGRAALRLLLRARKARRDVEVERTRLLGFLSRRFDADAAGMRQEYLGSEFRRWFVARQAGLREWPSPSRLGTTGDFGCEALYLLVRAARPSVVVETGVLYGASSAHILAAMERNGEGELHSIELGASADEPPHDFLVPPELTSRWHLIIGDSRRELPTLLARLDRLDLFHHDSLHTYEHMTWELETALPHLGPGGVLSSDDVLIAHSLREIFRPNAFPVFCGRRRLECSIFGNSGFALRRDTRGSALGQLLGALTVTLPDMPGPWIVQ
jgi:predicted O-methyltransferase YrrM